MASVKLKLDTRKNSRKKDGSYPITIKVFHKVGRFVNTGYSTSILGWDEINCKLRKSVGINRNLDCDEINHELEHKLYEAKLVVRELNLSIKHIDADNLINLFKEKWDFNPNSLLKKKVENSLSLSEWGKTMINRKESANKPRTAKGYKDAIKTITDFNAGKDIKFYEITVTFLKNFEAYRLGKGNSINTIGIYLRALRAIYNAAIAEDQFIPIKNVFKYYKIPASTRTKKRAISKEKINNIKALEYEKESALWHAKNYALIMFYCRGMNFMDLVKIRVKDISSTHLYYGRSKNNNPFAIKIVPALRVILDFYLKDKQASDFLLPTNYDGSTKHYQKYVTQLRRMNERLRIIAKDAGIEGKFTTYNIRHSWATIAKYLGVSTELISEAFGHSSVRTTEIYLRDFGNDVLDEVNAKVVA